MSNDSIVLELQRLAYRSDTNVSELCRLALITAYKLHRQDWIIWLKNELNGYEAFNDIPSYRVFFSWMWKMNSSGEYYKNLEFNLHKFPELCRLIINSSIPEIYSLNQYAISSNMSMLYYTLSFDERKLLENELDCNHLSKGINIHRLMNVLEIVRNQILEFALSLESEGILGHGLLFKEIEVEKATASQIFNIQNFQGTAGNVSGGFIMQENQ